MKHIYMMAHLDDEEYLMLEEQACLLEAAAALIATDEDEEDMGKEKRLWCRDWLLEKQKGH